ncbi:MAG: VWA-like domain-containing protein [Slackia sp.]|nr:VWA-like domain-containing protein [Slackia sp.]
MDADGRANAATQNATKGCAVRQDGHVPQSDEDVLAADLLDYAKEMLLVDVRFLEPALSRLACVPCEGSLFATDGAALYYDARQVAASFAEEPPRLARDILHMTLHCLFRHPFSNASFRPALWDLACDMAVEECITDLGFSNLAVFRESLQAPLCARFFPAVPVVTAEALYYLLQERGVSDQEAVELRRAFFVDDHAFWMRGTAHALQDSQGGAARRESMMPPSSDESVARSPSASDADGGDDASERIESRENPSPQDFADDALASSMMSMLAAARLEGEANASACFGAGGVPAPDVTMSGVPEPQQRTRPQPTDTFNESMQTAWREISLRADVALDDFSQLWGVAGGNFSLALKRSNVERVDYGEFLRRFVSRDEQMLVNDEEFDYVYYCYGLERYGNMPLIEPLEYADDGRIRDFVIAIDTSASTKGDTVAAFVERTCDILEDAGVFSDALNLYVIQCDAQVQDVARIASRSDARAWAHDLDLKGFGGTDFRPVFSYVDGLVDAGELTHLKGLLYFTDGQGAYPREKPRYDVAFVLTDEAYAEEPDVPPWAMRVKVDSGEFRAGASKEGMR